MKKTKLMLSLLLTITLICTMNVTVFAQDDYLTEFKNAYSIFKEEEQRRIDEITQSPNSEIWLGVVRENLPLDNDMSYYPTCTDCSRGSVSVGAAEATLADQGYHSGFFGVIKTDCYMYYYVSRGAEMCPVCSRVLWKYDGQHGCLEVHKKCSKGWYKICPMDVS